MLTKKIPATSAGTKLQNKEKPAVRELLTAGVGGSDEIVVRWSNAVWKEFINPKSKGTLSKKKNHRLRRDTFDCFYNTFFCFLLFDVPFL